MRMIACKPCGLLVYLCSERLLLLPPNELGSADHASKTGRHGLCLIFGDMGGKLGGDGIPIEGPSHFSCLTSCREDRNQFVSMVLL